MKFKDRIDYLIHVKDKETRESYIKGKYFVYSTLIFFLMCSFAIPFYFFVSPQATDSQIALLISNIVFLFVIVGLIFYYKKYGHRTVIVNVLTALGWVSNMMSYEHNGAIYSPDNIWGILISCWVFLVADRKSGLFWFILSGLTLFAIYFMMVPPFENYSSMAIGLGAQYHLINYVLAVVFLMTIVYLYESNQGIFKNEIMVANDELERKTKELELKNRDIMDSISYANKIQAAVLPHEESISRSIPLWFILYKPKDVVSGDFYWFNEIDSQRYIFICADCTGHGVPGAFMTVISSNLLNQTVIDNKITSPARIMQEVDRLLVMTLKQDKERYHNVQDGMDLSIMLVDKGAKEVTITSAKRPVVYIRSNQIIDVPSSKYSLGGMRTGEKKFEETKLRYQEDDMIYFFTDGYHDQFGGPKGKKFSSKKLKELLFSIHTQTMPKQKERLETEIREWMGSLEQVDDICVTGIRF